MKDLVSFSSRFILCRCAGLTNSSVSNGEDKPVKRKRGRPRKNIHKSENSVVRKEELQPLNEISGSVDEVVWILMRYCKNNK